MKKLFKDFIVFIFLTFFFFSILFFLNSEKFIYKDLKLIFDVDAGASHLLSKNIKKNIEYQKKEKEYYLYILFLLLVIFLFLIIIKLLFSLKYDCKKYKICEIYEDKNKSELFDLDAIREDEIKKNTDYIVKLDNQINNNFFKLRRSNSVGKEDNKRERLKSKPIIEPEFESYKYDILKDYYTVVEAQKEQKDIKNIKDYVEKDKFEVADFNFNTKSGKYNRSLFKRGKSLPFIKNTFVELYGIDEAYKREFSDLYDIELKKIKDAKKTPETLEKAQKEDAFILYYFKKENLMNENEQIDEALAAQAEKMNGVVNDVRRRNEDGMLKEKIAFYEEGSGGVFVGKLDTNKKKEKNENKKKEECKKEIIEIILGNMIKGFQNTRNELENFEIFCSKYAKYNDRKFFKSKKTNFDIVKRFKAKGDDKMEINKGAYMFDEFIFLIQKGIYFLLHEIAKFHNLSLKVLTKTTDQGVKKIANREENIRSNYIRVGKAINELQEDIYKAVEFRKRLLKGLEK